MLMYYWTSVTDDGLTMLQHMIHGKVKVLNPLSPHDALKHHFTSLKTDLIFLQLRVLERKFQSNHLHPLQVENCDSNSRLVVDEDDYCKFRLERVIISPHIT